MVLASNNAFYAVLKGQKICRTGLFKSMSGQRLFSYVGSALVQFAMIGQSRHLHTVCGSCQRLKAPASLSVIPCRYLRKLYPDIIDPSMIDKIQPQEDFKLQLDYTPVLGNKGPELVKKIEDVCVRQDLGRVFAVVYINKEQRKVTAEDLLVINGFFPPQIGDRIRLEKVLMVGSKDFTLTGTPLLSRDLVKVEATVIEKTLSNIKVNFTKRKKLQRLVLEQNPQSVLVINSIELDPLALQSNQSNVFQDSSTS